MRIALAAFFTCLTSFAVPPLQSQAAHDRYQNQLHPLIERFLAQQQVPGLAIAIVANNTVAYARGFGVMDLDRKADPVTTRSLFHMASITKTFVATSIMQLVEQGKIDLDAPVMKYLPYFHLADERYRTITVRQMVTHTSGMPDVEDYEWSKPQYDDQALERYVRSLSNLKLVFPPAAKFRYSNMAFEVLGDVIAKVSGESFDDYVQHHILAPLGMKDSTLLVRQADPKLMTWGHELDSAGEPFHSKVYPYNRIHSPSSNLHSNAVDMARWAIANMNRGELDGHRVLKAATYDLMWKPAHETGRDGHGRPQSVGISWFLGEYRGYPTVGHSGGDTGYATDLLMIPGKKIAVVWMANCDWVESGPVTHAALDTALGVKPEPIVMKRSIAGAMFTTYQSRGLDAAITLYRDLKKRRPDLYNFDVGELNELGQYLLDTGHTQEALRVWTLNTEVYPSSATAYDGLARGYAADGNRAMAITNYEKALKLDPKLKQAADELKKLKAPK